jgi:hypothetical protein
MASLKTYDVRIQAPGQNIIPFGPVSAENDDYARLELGKLVRAKNALTPLDPDSDVWMYDPNGAEVKPQSKVGEHLVDD